jgi:hypothetical protein
MTSSRQVPLPVIEDDTDELTCVVCGKAITDEHKVRLFGGAVRLLDDGENFGPSRDMRGFIGLLGDDFEQRIAEGLEDGQFAIPFCTTTCLRDFIEHAIQQYERNKEARRSGP